MKEKLTGYDVMGFLLSARGEGGWSVEETHKNLMAAIEADREAIRAETREELLRDHFKIGEVVEHEYQEGKWRKTTVWINSAGKGPDPIVVRRPPKKRAMTTLEIVRAVGSLYKSGWELLDEIVESKKTPRDELLDIAAANHIPTEVDE